MTSKISFFNLCRENMKRRIWLLVLTTLTFFIAMPLAMMIMLESRGGTSVIPERQLLSIFSGFFGMGMNSVFAGGFAIICAISGFSWLFSKKKVDLYHAIPVKREMIFAACYLNGILLYLIPYLASILVCLIIISRYMAVTGSLLSMTAITFGVHLLFFLFFYNVMLIAVMLSGNMINCLLSGGVLFIYVLAVRALLEAYLSCFILTHYERFGELSAQMRFTSPLMALLYFAANFIYRKDEVITYLTGGSFALYILQCLIFTVIAGVVALILYKKRPSEAAGRSIAFIKLLNAYRILLVIPLSLGCGLFMQVLVNTSSGFASTAWFCFGLLFGLILSHGFIEVLFQMDIRGMFSYKKQLLATGVVVFLLAFSIRGDWYGLARSMPKQDKVSSMAVYMPEFNEGTVYIDGYWQSMEEYLLENMDLPTEDVYEMARRGMEYTSKEIAWPEERTYFIVKYKLKNGKEILKRYWLKKEEANIYVERIYNSEQYKNAMLKRLQDKEIISLSISDIFNGSTELDRKWIPEFIELYCNEYRNLTLQDVRESWIVAEIDFECIGDRGKYPGRASSIPIYGACKATIAFLKEHGTDKILLLDAFNTETITSLEINIYQDMYQQLTGKEPDSSDYENRYYSHTITVSDREEIEKLAPYLIPNFYYSQIYETYSGVNLYVNGDEGEEKGPYSVYAQLLIGAPLEEIVNAHEE